MNFKKAFSMIEIIMVLVIIGFIVIMEMIILNNKINDYGQPYYIAYNALKKASYNVLADMYCPDPSKPDGDPCKIGPREFPKTSTEMCSRLAEFINTVETHCEVSEEYPDINDKADNINPEKPRMLASNSYRFYFSDLKTTKARDIYDREQDLEYFVVYADLNGEKRPNRITCDNTKVLPDIVPFAITRRGEVIPMGFPVYSKLYITAKIKLPGDADETKMELEDKDSASLSYYQAVYGAWPKSGTNEVQRNIDIPFSILFTNDDIYKDSNLRQCYTDISLGLKPESEYIDEAVSREDDGCLGGTFSCRVVLDKSLKTRW